MHNRHITQQPALTHLHPSTRAQKGWRGVLKKRIIVAPEASL